MSFSVARKHALAVVFIEWFLLLSFSIITVIMGLYGLVNYDKNVKMVAKGLEITTEQAKHIFNTCLEAALVIFLVCFAIGAGITQLLMTGIKKESYCRVSVWWWINTIILAIGISYALKTILYHGPVDYLDIAFIGISITYRIIILYLVREYINELGKELLPTTLNQQLNK